MRASIPLAAFGLVLAAGVHANPAPLKGPPPPGKVTPMSAAQQSSLMATMSAASRPNYGQVLQDLVTAGIGISQVNTSNAAAAPQYQAEGGENIEKAKEEVRAIAVIDHFTLPGATSPSTVTIVQAHQALQDAANQLAHGDANPAAQQDLAIVKARVLQAEIDTKELGGV